MVKHLFKNGQLILERQQSSILSAAAIITGAVFLSALMGIFRDRLLISLFYNEPASRAALDAYWVAFRLPDTVFQLLVIGALSAAFIPVYSKYLHKDIDEANLVANSMINLILLVFLLLAVPIFIFAQPLNQLITGPNFSQEQVHLASNFTRIMLLAQFFFAISNFMTGIIQANHRFLIPALSPLAYNLGIILGTLLLGPTIGLYGAAFGVVLGAFLHLMMQVPLAGRLRFSYRPVFHLRHPGVRQIIRLMLPRTAALSIEQIQPYVMIYLATNLAVGSLTLVQLAIRLMYIPVRIFGMPIGQASLPFLSQESATKDLKRFSQTLIDSLHQIFYLALPASVMLIILRIPAVRIAYGAKTFPWQATLLTGKIVAILALGVFAHAAIHLLARAFYALHNTKTPLLATFIAVIIDVVLSFYFVFTLHLGVLGMAWGSTLAVLFQATFLLIVLIFKLGQFNLYSLFLPLVKMFVASAATGLFLWAPMRLLDEFIFDTTRTLNLVILTVIVGLIGLSVYFIFSKLLRIQQLDAYLQLLSKIGNWHKVLSSSQETLDQSSTSL